MPTRSPGHDGVDEPKGVAAWSKCPLGSAPARPLCRLRARLAALGSPTLPGVEVKLLGAPPLPRVLERAASKVANLTAVDPSGVVFYLDTDFKSEQNRFTTLDVLEVTRGP